MLSVLIPVYNFDVQELVKTLYVQLRESGIPFEILCYDDCSSDTIPKIRNQSISSIESVKYKELPANLGRSKIRNLLGSDANYPYLLFMDCDSKILSPGYIRNYLNVCKENLVVFGGRTYHLEPPPNDTYFRWYYGIHKEQKTALERQQNPYHSFMSNNFVIPKALFLSIKFEENINEYGHEDTLFGYELFQKHILIKHIDNPLEHIGLEPAGIFLQKSRQAINCLHFLINNKYKDDTAFYQSVTLLRYYILARKLRLGGLLRLSYNIFRSQIEKNLLSVKPSLVLFDFYKLGYLLSVESKHDL